jgi:hypothetical protein
MVDSCSLLVIWVWYFYNRWVHLSTSGNRRKVQSVHRVHVWVWPHHWLWGVQLCTSRCGTWEPAVWPFQWQLRVSLLCSLTQCNDIKVFWLVYVLGGVYSLEKFRQTVRREKSWCHCNGAWYVYGESHDRDSEEHSRIDNLDTRYVYMCRRGIRKGVGNRNMINNIN